MAARAERGGDARAMTAVLRRAAAGLALVLLGAAPGRPQPVADVPIDVVDGHIFIDARIDGSATPLRMVVDTGAGDVLAADTASALGVHTRGTYEIYGAGDGHVTAQGGRVHAIAMGNAVLLDQRVMILAFDDLRRAEGVQRFDGLIGHELFERYDVRIDYAARSLALYEPATAPHDAGAIEVPMQFDGTIPEVSGDVDGLAGTFTIDTGDRGSFTLTVPFVTKNDLLSRYQPRVDGIAGWGIGGPVRAKLTRVGHLRFGGVDIVDPVTRLPDSQRGFFTTNSVAGNIGYGVLRRFTVTFDYRDKRVYLTPNGEPVEDVYDRSGLWLVDAGSGFRVEDVLAGSPAALAGMRVGDVVAAIDGRDAGDVGLAAERAALRGPAGTMVALRLARGSTTLDVTFRLADIV